MKIYEQSIYINKENINCESPYTMIDDFKNYIWGDIDFDRTNNKKILRFVISNSYNSELLIAEDDNRGLINNLFNINPSNTIKNIDNFNTVLLIPTGIDCVIGGHAGDANAVARLIASNSDTLITHPNVVNASDINELPDNGMYVEGSIINRLISGMIGLKRVRSNKILLIMEEHENEIFNNEIVNTVSACRTTGIDCDIYMLEKGILEVESHYIDKKPSGYINNINPLIDIVNKYKNEYDAFAITTNIKLKPDDMHRHYFYTSDAHANPWGSVESMLTHTISEFCNVISAHAPMDENEQISKDIEKIGIVDPRKAAETYSATSLYCVLKGLYKAPHITNNFESIMSSIVEDSDITVRDISCMIIPYGCLGLTILTAMAQQIPIIAVKENTNLMDNHYPTFKDIQYNNLIVVNTYLEAVGAMQCLKEGISLDSVKRPLEYTKILNREIKKWI